MEVKSRRISACGSAVGLDLSDSDEDDEHPFDRHANFLRIQCTKDNNVTMMNGQGAAQHGPAQRQHSDPFPQPASASVVLQPSEQWSPQHSLHPGHCSGQWVQHAVPQSDHAMPYSDHGIPHSDHLVPRSDHLVPHSDHSDHLVRYENRTVQYSNNLVNSDQVGLAQNPDLLEQRLGLTHHHPSANSLPKHPNQTVPNQMLQPSAFSRNKAIIISHAQGQEFKFYPGTPMPRNMVWTAVKKTPHKTLYEHLAPYRRHVNFLVKVVCPIVAFCIKVLIAFIVVFDNVFAFPQYATVRIMVIVCDVFAVMLISYTLFVNRTQVLSQLAVVSGFASKTARCGFKAGSRHRMRAFVCLGLLSVACYFTGMLMYVLAFNTILLIVVSLHNHRCNNNNKAHGDEDDEPLEEKPWHRYLRPCSKCADVFSAVELQITKELSSTHLSNQCHIHRPFFATTQRQCARECAASGEGSVLRRFGIGIGVGAWRRDSVAEEEHELTVVCTEFSVDAAHVSDDSELYTWIHIPRQVKEHLRFFLSDVFVECPTNPVWQCLSYTRCRKVLVLRLLHREVIINDEAAGGEKKLTIKFGTARRRLVLGVRVAFRYNGWPRGAKQWIQHGARHFLPRDVLHQVIARGCYLVHDRCSDDARCYDNHALDWRYDFTQAVDVLMEFHRSKLALLLAFVILCDEFRSHLHYFTDYLRDLSQCLLYIFLSKAQSPKRVYFGPMVAENITCLAKEMLRKLSNCLKRRRLRHYFVCNENILHRASTDKIGAFIVCTNKVLDDIHTSVGKALCENENKEA